LAADSLQITGDPRFDIVRRSLGRLANSISKMSLVKKEQQNIKRLRKQGSNLFEMERGRGE